MKRRFPSLIAVALIACLTWSCSRPAPTASAPGEGEIEHIAIPENAVVLNFRVTGMHCNGCANALKRKLAKIDGVLACDASFPESSASITTTDPAIAPKVLDLFAELKYEGELLVDETLAEPAAEPVDAE